MRVKEYSKAATALITEGMPLAEVLNGLKETLKGNHHGQLYRKILRSIESAMTRTSRLNETRITVAHEKDFKSLDPSIKNSLLKIQSDGPMTYIVNKNVIGGYQIESKGHSIDATHKTKLRSLYKLLTESL